MFSCYLFKVIDLFVYIINTVNSFNIASILLGFQLTFSEQKKCQVEVYVNWINCQAKRNQLKRKPKNQNASHSQWTW